MVAPNSVDFCHATSTYIKIENFMNTRNTNGTPTYLNLSNVSSMISSMQRLRGVRQPQQPVVHGHPAMQHLQKTHGQLTEAAEAHLQKTQKPSRKKAVKRLAPTSEQQIRKSPRLLQKTKQESTEHIEANKKTSCNPKTSTPKDADDSEFPIAHTNTTMNDTRCLVLMTRKQYSDVLCGVRVQNRRIVIEAENKMLLLKNKELYNKISHLEQRITTFQNLFRPEKDHILQYVIEAFRNSFAKNNGSKLT